MAETKSIATSRGAYFSDCRKYRFALWRIWDWSLPKLMFIGLNPSSANETEDDPTIKSICRIAKANGYGGVYMLNCFAYVSTNPDGLLINEQMANNNYIKAIAEWCMDVVFAWGNFKVVKDTGRDHELRRMFPTAKVLGINKNGSPKHPLYVRSDVTLKPYRS